MGKNVCIECGYTWTNYDSEHFSQCPLCGGEDETTEEKPEPAAASDGLKKALEEEGYREGESESFENFLGGWDPDKLYSYLAERMEQLSELAHNLMEQPGVRKGIMVKLTGTKG